MKPWDLETQLTEGKLVELATRVIEIRFDALIDHDPDKGDGAWDLGTKVYERTIKQLAWAAGKEFPWLSVFLSGLYIDLKVDGCPVRIFRGDPDNPNGNVTRWALENGDRTFGKNGTEFFEGMEPPSVAWVWVMAVQTVGDGTPVRVIVEQVSDEGDTRNRWAVPLNLQAIRAAVEKKTWRANVESMAKPPIELEPAAVLPKATEDAASDERS